MTDLPDLDPAAVEARRKEIMRRRNTVLGLVLAFFAVLFFAITIAKMDA